MKKLIMILLPFMAFGCATTSANIQGRYKVEGAVPNWTGGTKELAGLPKPAEKIVVAVWKLPDETGQHRRTSGAATELSKAVTQGGVHMLLAALRQSGWFRVVEREGWPNLLQELKIREEMQRRGAHIVGGIEKLTEPKFMISGAITEYESHPISGGGGAAYRGFGFSVRAKVAHVAVDLRLTDIEKGEVIETVSTYKRILSEEVDFSIFRFMRLDELFELETGFTTNEPTQVCVREALEKAVILIIANGVRNSLWKPAREEDAKFFTNYLERSPKKPLAKAEKAEGTTLAASVSP